MSTHSPGDLRVEALTEKSLRAEYEQARSHPRRKPAGQKKGRITMPHHECGGGRSNGKSRAAEKAPRNHKIASGEVDDQVVRGIEYKGVRRR